MIGRTLAHYSILEKIGAGGMGVVYRARDERLDRDVALKVLPAGALADDAARRSFRKEALSFSKLNHPNIATVHDFNTQEGVDFLVMEFIPGMTLEQKLAGGALPDREIARLAPQLAQGLAAAHEQGTIHCDLKPGNVRVTPDGRVKILDFGLARRLHSAADLRLKDATTEVPTTAGTVPYMAPEQLRGEKVDARCDIYALGAVLYEMVTGQRPFLETWGPRLIDAILHEAPPAPNAINRRVSPALEGIILKAMDKEPDLRYQSAREMAVDLERLTGPLPLPQAQRARALRRRWPLVTAGALAALGIVAVVMNVGGVRERLLGRSGKDRIEAIVVLPFDNLLGDPSQDYLADGMTEALIADLAKTKTLRVVSRTSVLQYKGARKPLPVIAREQNADGVVEGTVLHSGDRVRITAKLIHAATDRHLWTNSYDRELHDVLALQSEVADAIAREITSTLNPQAVDRRESPRSSANPQAYEAYLKGRIHWYKPTVEDLKKSVEYLEKAVELDPESAPAQAGLANARISLVMFGGVSEKEAYPKAKAAVTRALEIDDSLAEAHSALALLRFLFEWDWPGAEEEFKRAVELDPANAAVHQGYSSYLTAMGRMEEALAEIHRAQELDPLSVFTNIEAGKLESISRRHDLAIAQLRTALEMDPTYAVAHDALGWAYLAKGMPEDAIAEFKTAISLPGNSWTMVVGLGYVYAVSGKRAQATQILEQLADMSRRRYVPAVGIATIHIGLGEKDSAFEWLEKAYADRETALVLPAGHSAFDSLRPDPRFQDLLRRVGLSRQGWRG